MSYSKTQEEPSELVEERNYLGALPDELIQLVVENLSLQDKSHLARTNTKIQNVVYNTSFFLPNKPSPLVFKEATAKYLRFTKIDSLIANNTSFLSKYFNTINWDVESREYPVIIPAASLSLITGLLSPFIANSYDITPDYIGNYPWFGVIVSAFTLSILCKIHQQNELVNMYNNHVLRLFNIMFFVSILVGGCPAALSYALGANMPFAMFISALSTMLCGLVFLKENEITMLISNTYVAGSFLGCLVSLVASLISSFLGSSAKSVGGWGFLQPS